MPALFEIVVLISFVLALTTNGALVDGRDMQTVSPSHVLTSHRKLLQDSDSPSPDNIPPSDSPMEPSPTPSPIPVPTPSPASPSPNPVTPSPASPSPSPVTPSPTSPSPSPVTPSPSPSPASPSPSPAASACTATSPCAAQPGAQTVTEKTLSGVQVFLVVTTYTLTAPNGMTFDASTNSTFGNVTTFQATSGVASKVSFLPNSLLVIRAGAVVKFLLLPVTFTGAIIRNEGAMEFTGNALFDQATVTGNGVIRFSAPGFFLTLKNTQCTGKLHLGQNTAQRRTNLGTNTVLISCGSTSDVVLIGNSAAVFQSDCRLAGTNLANSFQSLTSTTSDLLQVTNVSPASLPTMITTWSNPSGLPLEVVAIPTNAAYAVPIILYGNSGTCAPHTATIDGCAAGYLCSVTSQVHTANPSLCALIFQQQQQPATGGGSNSGLYALFALFALLIPIALCAGVMLWSKRQESAMDVAPALMAYAPAFGPAAQPPLYNAPVSPNTSPQFLPPSYQTTPIAATFYPAH